MATSGTVTFNQNRNQIIRSALRKVGAIAAGETPNQQIIQDAADQLNAMVKSWMASGIHIWTTTEAILFLQTDQVQYTLGSGSSDTSATVYTNTTLVGDEESGSTVIVVASNTQISNGIRIGITLDAGTIQWTTVSSFSGTTVTLAAALTDSCTNGANVYVASPNINRPLRIPAARRWNVTSNIETPLTPLSRLDYQALPNKTATGTVTMFYYDPRGGANTTGYFYVWPAPVDTDDAIKFTWYRPIEDFTTAAVTPDFPQEWLNCLVWNLAKELAPEYGLGVSEYQIIVLRAMETLDLVSGWDKEPESINFGVDFSQR